MDVDATASQEQKVIAHQSQRLPQPRVFTVDPNWKMRRLHYHHQSYEKMVRLATELATTGFELISDKGRVPA